MLLLFEIYLKPPTSNLSRMRRSYLYKVHLFVSNYIWHKALLYPEPFSFDGIMTSTKIIMVFRPIVLIWC